MGNSITKLGFFGSAILFENDYIGRGISPDKPALKCFCDSRQDVIRLAPKASRHISWDKRHSREHRPDEYRYDHGQYQTMTELAQNQPYKRIVLCSVLLPIDMAGLEKSNPADGIALNETH